MKNWFAAHFNPKYLFNPTPAAENNLLIYLTIIFVLIIIFGVLISVILIKESRHHPPYSKLKDKILNTALIAGIIGLVLVFFRWQEIPYLSIPILMLILNLVIIWQIGYIIIFWQKTTIKEIATYKTEVAYQKYLPNKTKK